MKTIQHKSYYCRTESSARSWDFDSSHTWHWGIWWFFSQIPLTLPWVLYWRVGFGWRNVHITVYRCWCDNLQWPILYCCDVCSSCLWWGWIFLECWNVQSSWNVEMSRPDWIPAVARLCWRRCGRLQWPTLYCRDVCSSCLSWGWILLECQNIKI